MLTSSLPKTLSLEAYRDLETIAEVKHEYHAGKIIEMTGGSINHNSILILTKSCQTIRNWFGEIISYFEGRTKNGVVEGINNKLKLIKGSGYGLRNFQDFLVIPNPFLIVRLTLKL
ncbi:hypothetical protein MTo_00677 [Microcystis aeruginosa NIES-1211]|jgi:hypothetical protein|uniref:Transposase IS204/IS1001/IS1096/IS1165 DDE domain-containing protein n=1 Tax=Microcystis aeruginosa NIES-2519 TaxID=2303981 RepID=A0A5A5QZW1_MICAE|nr:hypothetical protein B5D77_07265 [Microcystis sp. MC19]GBL13387.1 hypothetical protein MTo_00677 [Microcystis aeruginosa NIES-1211]GCA68593.1 hypothetical protein MiYa_00108 [Microcystis aeruginosa NIES-2519]GCA84006.1 hypothetical protein MiHa_01975 [Microcystis aeruginosa NIES-2522]GCA86711.1 hypothetical protein MiTa_00034 [Microcystis aeruginosa NIES-4264]